MDERTMVKLRDSRLTLPLQRLFSRLNLSIIPKFSSFEYQLVHFIRTKNLEYLIDVGAHHGEFLQRLNRLSCNLIATAYEPSTSAVQELSKRHGHCVEIKNLAITADRRSCQLFESGSPFASLLKRKDASTSHIGEKVDSITLLDAGQALGQENWNKTLLKVDVQGSELEVLESGGDFITSIPVVVTEAPLQTFYEGAARLRDLIGLMDSLSFDIGGIHTPRFNNGTPLDCDIIFTRRN